MANTSTTLKKLAAAAALSACSLAQAGVLTFEEPVDSPVFFSGQTTSIGEFWVQTFGGTQEGDLTGFIFDPSTDECTQTCPVNNPSHYYASLNDSYFYFGYNNDNSFKVRSLQASFIGTGLTSYPAVAGLLVLQGFNAAGAAIGAAKQLALAGPNGNGQFNFATYNLGTFSNTEYSFVRVLGYACDSTGNCARNLDLGNFAIDNIETIPEPTSWALIGLGLLGLGMFTRRRAA